MISMRAPTLADLEYCASHMRASDWQEIVNVVPHGVDHPLTLARHINGLIGRGNFSMCCAFQDRPVVCLGWTELHPGVFEAWAFGTDEFPKVSTELTKFVRRQLRPSLLSNLGVHRMQAISRFDHHDAHRWLRVLGFKPESVLKFYGRDGSDYVMFRATRSDIQCAL